MCVHGGFIENLAEITQLAYQRVEVAAKARRQITSSAAALAAGPVTAVSK